MACLKRQQMGYCHHHQCQHSHETEQGYECVDVVEGYCEVGSNCIRVCEFSFPDIMDGAVSQVFKEKYGV